MIHGIFVLFGLASVVMGEQCKLCVNQGSCCDIALTNGAGACTLAKIDYTLQARRGRPLWLEANDTTSHKTLGVSFPPLDGKRETQQIVQAHSYFPFNEDVIYSEREPSSLCSRRWGCISCNGRTCGTGWANATITPGACGEFPKLQVVWWGEDLNHGAGVMELCLSYNPDQVQPQPPNPPNNHTFGASWSLYLGNGNDAGDWPRSQYDVSC